jgi:hypothetical protein
MAIKFFSEFADEKGEEWQINIQDTAFPGGTPIELALASDGFTLSYKGDNEKKFTPIIGSSVSFTVFNDSSGFETFLNTTIPTSEEGQLLVEILKDPGTGSEMVWWRGVLLTEQIEQLDEPAPTPVTLTASDDLAHLGTLDTDEFLSISVPDGIAGAIWACLSFTRTFTLYDSTDPFLRYLNDFEVDGFTGSDYLGETAFNYPAVYNDTTNVVDYPTMLELLRSLCITFNARVFMAEGKWWFMPVNLWLRELQGDPIGTTPELYGILKNRTAESISGLTKSNFASNFSQTIDSTNLVKQRGGTITYTPGVKKVTRRRLYKGNTNIFYLADFGATFNATGAQLSFSDLNITYFAGQEFNIELSTNITIDAANVAENPANNYLLRADITLQIGTQYWTNSGWSGTAGVYSIILAQWQYANGLDIGTGFIQIQTDALPSDQIGFDCSFRYRVFNGFGSEQTSSVTVSFLYPIFRGLYGAVGQGPGDAAVYTAITSANNQVEITQDNVITGNVSVNWYSGGFDVGSQHVSSQTATAYPIHRLGVREILAQSQLPTQVQRGTFYARNANIYLHPWNLLVKGAREYGIFEMEYSANRREYTIERFAIGSSFTNITLPVVEVEYDNPQADYGAASSNVANKLATDLERLTTGAGTVIQQIIRIDHSSGSTYTVDIDDTNGFMYMSRWVDTANGNGTIYLPKVADNEGRMLRFKSDDSITANDYYVLSVDASEYTNGVRIDGQQTFTMNRSYDGIMVLCFNDQWYVVQRKSK